VIKTALKFTAVLILLWLPLSFGFGGAAEVFGLPDSTFWLWSCRAFAAIMACAYAWFFVGASGTSAGHEMLLVIGHVLRAVFLLFAVGVAAALLIKPATTAGWIGASVYPRLVQAEMLFVPYLIVAALLALPRRIRFLGGSFLVILSYLFGITLWTLAACASYDLAGGRLGLGFGIIGGLVGVFPIAFVAAIVKKAWLIAAVLLIGPAVWWGSQKLGAYLAASAAPDEAA
jgi:hypothetical protein